jgi:hypothetical protein
MGSIEWIQLAQDRGRWRSLVNTVMEPAGSGATELVDWLVSGPLVDRERRMFSGSGSAEK